MKQGLNLTKNIEVELIKYIKRDCWEFVKDLPLDVQSLVHSQIKKRKLTSIKPKTRYGIMVLKDEVKHLVVNKVTKQEIKVPVVKTKELVVPSIPDIAMYNFTANSIYKKILLDYLLNSNILNNNRDCKQWVINFNNEYNQRQYLSEHKYKTLVHMFIEHTLKNNIDLQKEYKNLYHCSRMNNKLVDMDDLKNALLMDIKVNNNRKALKVQGVKNV